MAAATPELLIRADASSEIGIGHVMRCLALAQAWAERGGRATFVTAAGHALRARLEAEGFRTVEPEAADGGDRDLAGLLSVLDRQGGTAVVVDGYHFGLDYQRTVRERAGCLVVLDDHGDRPRYAADLLLNQNLGAERIPYECDEGCKLLLGPEHVLLRREFARWRGWTREFPERAKRVLVQLGGGEHARTARRVVQALGRRADPQLAVRVVVGPEARVEPDEGVDVELVRAPEDVSPLMADADLAVLGAGSTCWEACFLALPALTVVFADNQVGIASALDAAGAVRNLGPADRLDDDELATQLGALLDDAKAREALGRRAHELVDGYGADRVAAAIGERLAA
jgi:UDP-2,4-diacetamido-2,4,6-trideoxy-beta-L-altropyranose hydrolase